MAERSPLVQAVYALVLSLVALALVLLCAWFAEVADAALGHGPLPSGLGSQQAYIVTVLTVLFGLLPGAALMVGVRQSKVLAPRFAWLVYLLVGVPLLLVLFTPLQRFGASPFLGLPPFLVGLPGHMVIAVALGALVFSAVDLQRLAPTLAKGSAKLTPKVRSSSGAVKGLPGRFTPNAWRALSHMQEEAQRFEHAYMGTEHLLLGLLHDNRSQAVRVIVNLGGDPAGIKGQLEGVIGRRGSLYTGATGMTRRCQRVIEAAARLARAGNTRTVSTGHLLHALVEEPEDISGQLLESSGVTADRVSGELRHLGPESGE